MTTSYETGLFYRMLLSSIFIFQLLIIIDDCKLPDSNYHCKSLYAAHAYSRPSILPSSMLSIWVFPILSVPYKRVADSVLYSFTFMEVVTSFTDWDIA